MAEATIEVKIGKIWTKLTEVLGRLKHLEKVVLGNGIPGHEKRIGALEDCNKRRRETCPILQELEEARGRRQLSVDRIITLASSLISSGILVYLVSGGKAS